MEAPPHGALTLVRVIGVACLVIAILELGLYWARCSIPSHHEPIRAVPVLLRLIPAAAGILILIRARAIADWISNILDL